jgi:hypothetical protein
MRNRLVLGSPPERNVPLGQGGRKVRDQGAEGRAHLALITSLVGVEPIAVLVGGELFEKAEGVGAEAFEMRRVDAANIHSQSFARHWSRSPASMVNR